MIYFFKRREDLDHEPVVALMIGIDGQAVLFVKATIDFNIGPEYVSLPYTGEDASVIVTAFKELNNSLRSHWTLINLVIKWHCSFVEGVVLGALLRLDFDVLQYGVLTPND